MKLMCVNGPLDGKRASDALGRRWPAAAMVQYGSRVRNDGTYGHLIGHYELVRERDWVYRWSMN